ncbi:MAG: FtsW/RodA/SpoVE family cell cycle protein [Bacteroidota bacterium]
MTITIKEWLSANIKGDKQIWWIVAILTTFSLLIVYSASGAKYSPELYLFKHLFHLLLALIGMWFAHRLDYGYYAKLSNVGLIASALLLVYARYYGVSLNEATRWVVIAGVQFQPSDLAKLALIANLATMLARRQRISYKENLWHGLGFMILKCCIICGLIAMSNASNGLLLLVTCFIVMFIGRVPLKYLASLSIIGLLCVVIGLKASKERWDTAINRVDRFVNSWQNSDNTVYQIKEGYKAMANGGVFGVGPGNSHQRNFLPYCYADFIYPIIIEEWGLMGGVFIIIIFIWLLYRGLHILQKSDRALGGLLAAGLSTSLVLQALVNMAVTVELFPTTGLTLPLLSMGGTSLLFTGLSIGIILSVSRGGVDESKI